MYSFDNIDILPSLTKSYSEMGPIINKNVKEYGPCKISLWRSLWKNLKKFFIKQLLFFVKDILSAKYEFSDQRFEQIALKMKIKNLNFDKKDNISPLTLVKVTCKYSWSFNRHKIWSLLDVSKGPKYASVFLLF